MFVFFFNHVLNNLLHQKERKKRKKERLGRRLINYSFNVLNWIRRKGPCLGFSVPSLTVVVRGRCCHLPSINEYSEGGTLCFQVEIISPFQNALHFITISQLSDRSYLFFPQYFFFDFSKENKRIWQQSFFLRLPWRRL